MVLPQARYFLALANTLSFTRAAEQTKITQPALTKAIQKLESEFGGLLIYRERSNTQLTDLGALVLPMIEKSVAAMDLARSSAEEFRAQGLLKLKIGLTSTIALSTVTGLLLAAGRLLPNVSFETTELPATAVSKALMDGEVHVAIAGDAVPVADRIDRWPLFTERYVVLCGPDHPFAGKANVSLGELADTTWLSRGECEVWDAFCEHCFPASRRPNVSHRCHQEGHMQSLAVAGLGVMLAPEGFPTLNGLVSVPIEEDPVQRTVNLLVVAGRRYSHALEVLVRCARQRDWQSTERTRQFAI